MAATPRTTRPNELGFTLVEMVVVIAIAALVFQLVVSNMGSMIPARAMDSAAAQIVSRVDWLRSEARLQGKTYKLVLDLNDHRYAIEVPATDRLAAHEIVEETFDLGWSSVGDNVHLAGCSLAGDRRFTEGLFRIALDENGFTADQAVFLVHAADPSLVWSVRLYGLTGHAEIVRSFDGTFHPLEKQEEGRF